ncbi:MAG: InlB B-repeat-containing protein, partial [Paludibacteraceae bacterium]|nr:InlB B-repeat-containing protein [Paludibacteraceae bacterium]
NQYTVLWKSEDGTSTIETDDNQNYGAATAFNGTTPTKDATAQYTYTFDGWAIVPNGDKVYNNGATPTVSGLATYYAHFGSTIRSYDVTFDLKGHGDDIDSQVKDYGSLVDEPAAPEATGYTFAGWYKESSCTHEWTFASDVVTGATTLYAKWTPNTNTPYTVKHYKQKLDGTYQNSEPNLPDDTDNLTGTTDAKVTPATKSYTGFKAPNPITETIEADGSLVIGYCYSRNSYTLVWNWASGSTSAVAGEDYTASGAVKYEAPLTYPANVTMTRTGYDFNGWSTSVTTMPAEELTITATWTPKKYAITWKSEDGSSTLYTDATADYDSEPVYGGATPTKAQDADYTYTFDGWTTEADGSGTFYAAGATPTVSGDATYYAHFTKQFLGTVIDIIDWTFEADKAVTVTLNMNGYSSRNKTPWHIGVSGTDIDKVASDRNNADRSLTIDISSMNLTSGSTLTIIGKDDDGEEEYRYTFRVPYVYTSNTTLTTSPDGEDNTIFVHDGATLTIDGTVEVSSVYVNPQAKLVITENRQLTVLKRLVMRTTAWKAAELLDNGTLSFGSPATGQMYYTRQISDKTSYYQFSLPYASRIEDVFSSNSKSTPYGNWILKRYDGASRAEHGEEGPEGQGNWVSLSSTDDIQPYTGYEIWSNSAYYRELFFPVTYAKHSIDDDIAVAVHPHTGTAATQNIANAGWNYISTPFTFTYMVEDAPPTVTISELTEDNHTYWQHVVDPTHPLPTARPFLYQARTTAGTLTFGETITFESSVPSSVAAHRNATGNAHTSLQWIRLTAKAIETQLSDETNILISSRYTAAYELGCDVQKMLSNGNRPQVYTSLACGMLTTTAVPDDITAIPLGLYTPEAGLYTLTVDANRWQDRIDHVWLLDTESGTTHDLLFSPYQYAAEKKMTTSRFVLMPVMKAESSTESGNGSEVTTDVEDSGNTDIHVNINGGQISVSGLTAGMPVMLYDATGRLIAKHDVQQSREVSINVSAAGVYLLRYGNDTRRVVIGK